MDTGLISPPASREARRDEKSYSYFDLKQIRLYEHIEFSHSLLEVVFYGHS
jgi:hypothetical protein